MTEANVTAYTAQAYLVSTMHIAFLPNRSEFISYHIMPLVINSQRGKHTDTYIYTWRGQNQFLETRCFAPSLKIGLTVANSFILWYIQYVGCKINHKCTLVKVK